MTEAVRPFLESHGSADLFAALKRVLIAKNIVSAQEIDAQVESTDSASAAAGAAIIAKAWVDPDYKAVLLSNGTRAAEMMGVSMRGMPPLGVLENTAKVHNLVVCTLCSCYPRAILGYPPFWFKSPAYRARAVRDPRGLLAEFGLRLDEGVAIQVVDSTADYRWMVLPQRPSGTEGWSAEQLAEIVKLGDMIGVSVPEVDAARRADG
jgi:nitrile hydratase